MTTKPERIIAYLDRGYSDGRIATLMDVSIETVTAYRAVREEDDSRRAREMRQETPAQSIVRLILAGVDRRALPKQLGVSKKYVAEVVRRHFGKRATEQRSAAS